jgi:hypothetical protein
MGVTDREDCSPLYELGVCEDMKRAVWRGGTGGELNMGVADCADCSPWYRRAIQAIKRSISIHCDAFAGSKY